MKPAKIKTCQIVAASPPARGRGLKLIESLKVPLLRLSPPARGRGLKQLCCRSCTLHRRRPPRGGVD